MKAIKYLFIAALTAGYSANALAQDGSKADIDAVKKIISSKPADLDKQMKPFFKANKKNAENLVAFGRAFYEAKDTANAKEFANLALQASKNKCAPAFILLGDIAAVAFQRVVWASGITESDTKWGDVRCQVADG